MSGGTHTTAESNLPRHAPRDTRVSRDAGSFPGQQLPCELRRSDPPGFLTWSSEHGAVSLSPPACVRNGGEDGHRECTSVCILLAVCRSAALRKTRGSLPSPFTLLQSSSTTCPYCHLNVAGFCLNANVLLCWGWAEARLESTGARFLGEHLLPFRTPILPQLRCRMCAKAHRTDWWQP